MSWTARAQTQICLSLSLSLSHTHTHAHTHLYAPLSLSHTPLCSLCARTDARTHACTSALRASSSACRRRCSSSPDSRRTPAASCSLSPSLSLSLSLSLPAPPQTHSHSLTHSLTPILFEPLILLHANPCPSPHVPLPVCYSRASRGLWPWPSHGPGATRVRGPWPVARNHVTGASWALLVPVARGP
jgi:hypothetical protein